MRRYWASCTQVWTKLSRGEAASKPTSRLGAPVGLVVTPRHHVKWPWNDRSCRAAFHAVKSLGKPRLDEDVTTRKTWWENDWLPVHLLCLGLLFDICNVRLNKNTCVWQAHVKFRALKFEKKTPKGVHTKRTAWLLNYWEWTIVFANIYLGHIFIWTSICICTPRPLVLSYCDSGYRYGFSQGPLCREFGLQRSVQVDETHMYFQTSIINMIYLICTLYVWICTGPLMALQRERHALHLIYFLSFVHVIVYAAIGCLGRQTAFQLLHGYQVQTCVNVEHHKRPLSTWMSKYPTPSALILKWWTAKMGWIP